MSIGIASRYALVLLALTLPAQAGGVKRGAMSDSEIPKLACRMEAAPASSVGQPHLLRFSLRNDSKRPVWVLRWYTPLEGLRGRVLRVTRDGAEVPYRGLMMKRLNPVREDYVRIAPRDSATAEVDLAKSYDLTVPGAYEVAFESLVHDFAWDAAKLPAPAERHRDCPVVAPPPVKFERRAS